jgi:hypothetical protein
LSGIEQELNDPGAHSEHPRSEHAPGQRRQ